MPPFVDISALAFVLVCKKKMQLAKRTKVLQFPLYIEGGEIAGLFEGFIYR